MQALAKGDFYEPWHGELWILIKDLIEAGRVAAVDTLIHDISQDRDVGGKPATRYLREDILGEAASRRLVKELASGIADLALRRRMIASALDIIETAESSPASVKTDDLRNKWDDAGQALFQSTRDLGIRHIAQLGDGILNTVQKAMQEDRPIGLNLGLKCVQDLTGPFLPQRQYILLGHSGSGKTALAAQLGMHIARPRTDADLDAGDTPKNVLMFEIEMDPDEIVERKMAQDTDMTAERIERGLVDREGFERLIQANENLKGSGFYVDSPAYPTMAHIRGKAARFKKMHGLDLLIIDHYRYLAPPDRGMREFEAIQQNLQASKRMARELDIPVLMLGQLKGEFLNGPPRAPEPGDAYGGSSVEQEADVMFFVNRMEILLTRKKPTEESKRVQWAADLEKAKGLAQIVLGKRRGGKSFGTREASWDGARTRFGDNVASAAFKSANDIDPNELPF